MVSRTEAKSVPCTVCKVQAGEPCWKIRAGKRIDRISMHRERHIAYIGSK